MKTFKSILKKALIVIMVMTLVLTSFAGSAESVSAHRRGVTHSRKHVVRRRANGHAKKSHRARRVTRRRVVRRKAPRRRKVPVRRRKAVRHAKRHVAVRKKRPAPKKRRVVRKKRAAKKRQAPRRKKAAKKRKAAPKKKRAAKKRKAASKKKAATKHKVSKKKKATKQRTKKRQVSHAKKSVKRRQPAKRKPAAKKKKASGSALIATISRKTGISKSLLSMVGDFVGYNDLYTMFTGKDAATGKPRSRWIGAAWTAFNFIPISKVEKIAKVAKILVTARKGEKVAKDVRVGHLATRAITKRTGETAAKKAAQKRAEQLVKQRKKVKPVKAKPKVKRTKTPGRRVMSKKAYKQKYGKKVTKKQKQFNKKKQAKRARKQSRTRSKGRAKKKVPAKKTKLVTKSSLKQLKAKGVKYSAKDVLMVTKNSDGKLMWLEKGNSRAGLKHIELNQLKDFKERGIAEKDIPSFLDKTVKTKPLEKGSTNAGPYSEYQVNGKKYRVAYGTNGFVVSFYPVSR